MSAAPTDENALGESGLNAADDCYDPDVACPGTLYHNGDSACEVKT